MKNNILKLVGLVLILVVVVLSSCIGPASEEELQKESDRLRNEENISMPIWNTTDVKLMQLEKGSPIYTYNVKTDQRPPFYKGSMPLEYSVVYPPWGINEYPLVHDFKDFRNYFVYQGTILVGAQTYNSDGSIVLADIRLHYSITEDKKQRITAKEFHYKDGKLIFESNSEFDAYEGVKTKEIEKIGNKIRDYYFIMPVGVEK